MRAAGGPFSEPAPGAVTGAQHVVAPDSAVAKSVAGPGTGAAGAKDGAFPNSRVATDGVGDGDAAAGAPWSIRRGFACASRPCEQAPPGAARYARNAPSTLSEL